MWGVLELVCTDLTSAKAQTEDSESGFPFPLLPAHSLFPGVDKGSREKGESGLLANWVLRKSTGTELLPQWELDY